MNGKRLINDLQIAIVVYQDIFYVTRCRPMDNECNPKSKSCRVRVGGTLKELITIIQNYKFTIINSMPWKSDGTLQK